MKAILMSIRPEWVAKILNGEKTIEVRKHFPKDYVGWVYIYVTKGKELLVSLEKLGKVEYSIDLFKNTQLSRETYPNYNGKVVARFWCDKVEEIYGGSFNQFDIYSGCYFIGKECPLYFEQKSCLTQSELKAYLGDKQGYAIHVTKLEIFDKPKEISEFKHIETKQHYAMNGSKTYKEYFAKPLTRAPQSWCYIEVDL